MPDSDSTEQVAGLIAAAVSRTVTDAMAGLDLGVVEAATTAVAAARRVEIYGVGGSAMRLVSCSSGPTGSASRPDSSPTRTSR